MDKVVDQWVGESLALLEMLERELIKQQSGAARAMAAVQRHADEINRLERNIGIVRRALHEVECVHAVSMPIELVQEEWSGRLVVMPPPPPPPRRAANAPREQH